MDRLKSRKPSNLDKNLCKTGIPGNKSFLKKYLFGNRVL